MSFSSETKKELSKIIPEKKCCTLAEIAGFARMNGSIRLMGGGRMNVSLTSEDPSIARLFKQMIQSYRGCPHKIGTCLIVFRLIDCPSRIPYDGHNAGHLNQHLSCPSR